MNLSLLNWWVPTILSTFVGFNAKSLHFQMFMICRERSAVSDELWLFCIQNVSVYVRVMCHVHLYISAVHKHHLPHCSHTVGSHHGGKPSLCEGQKRRVPPVGDNGDLWEPVTAVAGKHALLGSVCELTAILYLWGEAVRNISIFNLIMVGKKAAILLWNLRKLWW